MSNNKKNKLSINIFLSFFFSFCLLFPLIINAAIVPCTDDCSICDFFKLVKNLLNFITGVLAIPIATVILIYGGAMWVISGGSEEKIKKGKTAITRATYGLLIVFGAWLIVNTILTWFGNSDLLKKFWPGLGGCGL